MTQGLDGRAGEGRVSTKGVGSNIFETKGLGPHVGGFALRGHEMVNGGGYVLMGNKGGAAPGDLQAHSQLLLQELGVEELLSGHGPAQKGHPVSESLQHRVPTAVAHEG